MSHQRNRGSQHAVHNAFRAEKNFHKYDIQKEAHNYAGREDHPESLLFETHKPVAASKLEDFMCETGKCVESRHSPGLV